ncbi:unnamed protein product, partial [marine sediment metagenome]
EQESVVNLGGTMRLGAYACHLKSGSKVASIYGKKTVSERHRRRFDDPSKFFCPVLVRLSIVF